MFWGRSPELQELKGIGNKKTASLIVLQGRRRIGKSSLLEKFGNSYGTLIEISGLAPGKGNSAQAQLDNFAEQLSAVVKIPGLKFVNWTQAFIALAKFTEKGRYFILLDEISWMSYGDKSFSGKLKIAWDKQLKKNPKLILSLCGSVSSWIEKNILRDTDFVGRISWQKNLGELDVRSCLNFWGKAKVSSKEILKVLAITGGVPKYLEEIRPSETAEQNIQRLCFSATGYLFIDFDKIFNEIFDSRSSIYKKILEKLSIKKLSIAQLAVELGMEQNGDFSEYLSDMEASGFLSRDYTWDLEGKRGKLSQFRIKDNYLRFYLNYITSNEDKIRKKIFDFSTFDSLFNWDTIAGLQFENLVLNNIDMVLNELRVPITQIIQYGPYFQTKTKTRKGCQVDLMVLCKRKYIYLCELKYKNKIGMEVIDEVEEKIKRLNLYKKFSIRPVLIYSGELTKNLSEADYFSKMLSFEDLF
ncbi:MAG: ATP-binding protein [Bacteriovoracaceae bacterium]|nr:ATP-binding protein [Bacteriovoracaceae bacterium]